VQVVVYAPAERADAFPLFLLYPYMHSVVVNVIQRWPIIVDNTRFLTRAAIC
jgi:hypothetical protein